MSQYSSALTAKRVVRDIAARPASLCATTRWQSSSLGSAKLPLGYTRLSSVPYLLTKPTATRLLHGAVLVGIAFPIACSTSNSSPPRLV